MVARKFYRDLINSISGMGYGGTPLGRKQVDRCPICGNDPAYCGHVEPLQKRLVRDEFGNRVPGPESEAIDDDIE